MSESVGGVPPPPNSNDPPGGDEIDTFNRYQKVLLTVSETSDGKRIVVVETSTDLAVAVVDSLRVLSQMTDVPRKLRNECASFVAGFQNWLGTDHSPTVVIKRGPLEG